MGRYRGGGRGGISGIIIELVAYLIVHIVKAVVGGIANKSREHKRVEKKGEAHRLNGGRRRHVFGVELPEKTSQVEPEPIAPEPKPVTTIEKLHDICAHLEDEVLVANVQEIIKYTALIDEALIKYPNAKKGELVQEYNAQLLNFLNSYNEAEDLRLSNKASLSMMENTRIYAADLVKMTQNVLEQIYEANVEATDVNIEVMRRDMRMRGLVDDK